MSKAAKDPTLDRRQYPRIKASCPIRYTVGDSDVWEDAMLFDYSATGIRLICDDLLLRGTKIKIEVLPKTHQHIPQLPVECVVNRFALDDTCSFQIGCEFVSTARKNSQKS